MSQMKKSRLDRVVKLLRNHDFEMIINPIHRLYLRLCIMRNNGEAHYVHKYGHSSFHFFRKYQKNGWYYIVICDNNFWQVPGIATLQFAIKNPFIPSRARIDFTCWYYLDKVRDEVLARTCNAMVPFWNTRQYTFKDIWQAWKDYRVKITD